MHKVLTSRLKSSTGGNSSTTMRKNSTKIVPTGKIAFYVKGFKKFDLGRLLFMKYSYLRAVVVV